MVSKESFIVDLVVVLLLMKTMQLSKLNAFLPEMLFQLLRGLLQCSQLAALQVL